MRLIEQPAKKVLGTPARLLLEAFEKLRAGLASVTTEAQATDCASVQCFTVSHAMEILNLPDSTTRRRLQAMEELGWVEPLSGHKAGRATRYALTATKVKAAEAVLPLVAEVRAAMAHEKVARSAQPVENPDVAPCQPTLAGFGEVKSLKHDTSSACQTSPNPSGEVKNLVSSDIPHQKPLFDQPRHLATENEGAANTYTDLREEKAWE